MCPVGREGGVKTQNRGDSEVDDGEERSCRAGPPNVVPTRFLVPDTSVFIKQTGLGEGRGLPSKASDWSLAVQIFEKLTMGPATTTVAEGS